MVWFFLRQRIDLVIASVLPTFGFDTRYMMFRGFRSPCMSVVLILYLEEGAAQNRGWGRLPADPRQRLSRPRRFEGLAHCYDSLGRLRQVKRLIKSAHRRSVHQIPPFIISSLLDAILRDPPRVFDTLSNQGLFIIASNSLSKGVNDRWVSSRSAKPRMSRTRDGGHLFTLTRCGGTGMCMTAQRFTRTRLPVAVCLDLYGAGSTCKPAT